MLPLAICNQSSLLAGQACGSRQVSPGKVRVEGHQNPAHGARGYKQREKPVEELHASPT